MTKITTATPSRLVVTIGLCFMVALMEGLDLQAAGIAAVGMAQAFALDKMQMGWIFSAGILGLLPGALVGGMLADRHGRKRILLGSVLLFGLFSLATALTWSFPTLLLARLLTGVGLGAALPNLIALTSEAAGSRFRGRAVSLMYCGVPIGAALAAALGFSGLAAAWQIIFWIGGVVPLLLIPLLMRWLPESQAFQRAEASVPLRTLFAPGQVKLVDTLQSLSVTKIGQPLATAVEATAAAEPAPLPEEEIRAEHRASPLVDDKQDQG